MGNSCTADCGDSLPKEGQTDFKAALENGEGRGQFPSSRRQ